MKKIALLLCAAMIASLTVVFVSAGSVGETSTASYATTPPVIDGEIDEIWNTTAKQELECGMGATDIAAAYTQILWDETGYYFLAYVEDSSLTENDEQARNSVDFWVSEMNTKEGNYDTDPGDWHFCISSDGHESYFTGNPDVLTKRDAEVGFTDKGYIVEFYVPYLSGVAPKEGHTIGYTVSVNDDYDNDGTRDGVVFWSMADASHEYWAKTIALPAVTLVGADGAGAGQEDQEVQFPGLDAKKWSFDTTLAEMDVLNVTMLSEELFSSDWEGAKLTVTDATDPQIKFNVAKYLRLGGLDKLEAEDAKVITLKCKAEGNIDDFELFYCSSSQVNFSPDSSCYATNIWTDEQGYTYFMYDLEDLWEGSVNFLRFDPSMDEETVVYLHEMVILDSVEEAYAYGGYELVTTEQTETSAEETTAPEATEQVTEQVPEQVTEQVTEPTKAGGCKSFVALGTVVVALLGLGIICTKKKD